MPHTSPGRLGRVRDAVVRQAHGSLPGLWTALAFATLSFTPSLLPRPSLFQGLVAAVTGAIGYALGVLGAWVWREFAGREPREPSRRRWRVLAGVATALLLLAMLVGRHWQQQLRGLNDLDGEPWPALALVPVVGALTFALLICAARGLRYLSRRWSAWLGERMGARAARALGIVSLTLALLLGVTGVLGDALLAAFDEAAAVADARTPEGAEQPTTALRSGGPDSLVDWETLGYRGKEFLSGGPGAEEISAWSGGPALDPVRAYASIDTEPDLFDRAQLVVDDLERAGGFERSYLLVVTTTGTGWVEPSASDSFEYLTGGDSAIASMQYSYQPSWLSYLVDPEVAGAASRALFDAVYARWAQLPVEARPKLYVFGESLGSFGTETAFSGVGDLANRVDGALLVGPPSFNTLYPQLTDDREPGSPQIEPVFDGGEVVRFSRRPATSIPPEDAAWPGSRVLYLLNPSDPITWWSPDLLFSRPDWLEEERGEELLDAMHWLPVVTFWQTSVDLAMAFSMPPGRGHNFTGEHVDGWAAVLDVPAWDQERSRSLRAIIIANAE